MTFKHILLKMFRANLRRYLMYFLSSSFSITVFFMYASLVFNPQVLTQFKNSSIGSLMVSAMLIVGIFSIFFITYAHHSFIKSRNSEFGMFLTLGITRKDIRRLIIMENGLIGISSLVIGLIMGTVFSRLFFLIVITLLNISEVSFSFSVMSYVSTITLFLFIFLIVIGMSYLTTRRLEITELLKSSRKGEKLNISHPILGIVGLLFIILSFLLFKWHLEGKIFPEQNYWMVAFFALNLVGLYFFVSQLGSMITSYLKTSQYKYKKNLLTISEIEYRYPRNVLMIYITSLLCAVIIFLIGLSYSYYSQALQWATDENPYHLHYVLDHLDNDETIAAIKKQIEEAKTPVVQEKTLTFINGAVERDYKGGQVRVRYAAISESDYEAFTGEDLSLRENEAATLLLSTMPENKPAYSKDKLQYRVGDQVFSFDRNFEVTSIPFNLIHNISRVMVIINTADFDKLVKINEKLVKQVHLVDFVDWKGIENLPEQIWDIQLDGMKGLNLSAPAIQTKSKPESRISVFQRYKTEFSFTLFIMSFIGILFFIIMGNVMLFRVQNTIAETKERYAVLSKIGIHQNEMKEVIANQLKIIFFVPFILGLITGILFMWFLSANIPFRSELIRDTLLISCIFFLFQFVYYLISKKKVIHEVLSEYDSKA